MDKKKLLLGLIVGVMGLTAVFAGTASAHELAKENTFYATAKSPISPATPGTITGVGSGEQEFRFSNFKFSCTTAKAKNGIANEVSSTFYASVKFSGCTTYFKVEGNNLLGPYKVSVAPIDFEFHQNHFAEFGGESESEVSLKNAGSVTANVASTKCEIYWEPQTIPTKAITHPEEEYSSVAYANEEVPTTKLKLYPSGFQPELVVTSALTKIKTIAEGGKCENFKNEETKSGYYKGTLRFGVKSGSLEYVEPAVED